MPAGQYGSLGLRSDGTTCNVGNKLGDRPSIKLFPKYSSGNALKAALFGIPNPDNDPSSSSVVTTSTVESRKNEWRRNEVENNRTLIQAPPTIGSLIAPSTAKRMPPRESAARCPRRGRVRTEEILAEVERTHSSPSAKRAEDTPNGYINYSDCSGQRAPAVAAAAACQMAAAPAAAPCSPGGGHSPYAQEQLIVAVKQGRRKLVKIAIEDGASVHARGDCGWTALHYAAASGNGAITRYLVQTWGADVMAKDSKGQTPRDVASKQYVRELLSSLAAGK